MTVDIETVAIVDDLLDRTGQAIRGCDFDLFSECIALPYRVETLLGTEHVETADALRRMFHHNVDYYRRLGVTDLARRTTSATRPEPDVILGLFETRMVFFGGQLKRAPYTCLATIRKLGAAWKVVHGQYLIDDSEAHNAALLNKVLHF